MDMPRRGFLKSLGVGAAAAAVPSVVRGRSLASLGGCGRPAAASRDCQNRKARRCHLCRNTHHAPVSPITGCAENGRQPVPS